MNVCSIRISKFVVEVDDDAKLFFFRNMNYGKIIHNKILYEAIATYKKSGQAWDKRKYISKVKELCEKYSSFDGVVPLLLENVLEIVDFRYKLYFDGFLRKLYYLKNSDRFLLYFECGDYFDGKKITLPESNLEITLTDVNYTNLAGVKSVVIYPIFKSDLRYARFERPGNVFYFCFNKTYEDFYFTMQKFWMQHELERLGKNY